MSNLLEIRNISKSFGHKAVLKDVTFNVPAGSIVGFIGDNGAGKSTTFKTILGLISQDRGKVKIFGEENLDKHIKFKEDIGVVFDAMNLPAHLTIKQLNHVFKNYSVLGTKIIFIGWFILSLYLWTKSEYILARHVNEVIRSCCFVA